MCNAVFGGSFNFLFLTILVVADMEAMVAAMLLQKLHVFNFYVFIG